MMRATWWAIAFAALVLALAISAHSWAQNDTEVRVVPLDSTDLARQNIGKLNYLGGVQIPRMGQNIGGLSGLRWDAESGQLIAITDDARWVRMTPTELNSQLIGLGELSTGSLLGIDGEPLSGKAAGDSESLSHYPDFGWLVGFERDHRIWVYEDLSGLPESSGIDLDELFRPIEPNSGLEAMAGNEFAEILCMERKAEQGRANCRYALNEASTRELSAEPPKAISDLGGVPTDADMLDDGTALILFRSWSRADGNGAAIVAYAADGTRTELATLRPPLTVDNFEGLAVREEGDRTFLYIVSDDNFSSSQRTLLMKFELKERQ
ncbi:MAG: esterase-like activity of phytase family protein [Pseudomonadota bacterium]